MFPILSNTHQKWDNSIHLIQPGAATSSAVANTPRFFQCQPYARLRAWGWKKVDKQTSWVMRKDLENGTTFDPLKTGGIGDLMIASFELHLMTLQMSDDGCGGCFWYILCSISISPLRMLFDEAISQTRGQTLCPGQLKLPVRARDRSGGRIRKAMKTTRIKTTVDPTKVSTVCEVGSSWIWHAIVQEIFNRTFWTDPSEPKTRHGSARARRRRPQNW